MHFSSLETFFPEAGRPWLCTPTHSSTFPSKGRAAKNPRGNVTPYFSGFSSGSRLTLGPAAVGVQGTGTYDWVALPPAPKKDGFSHESHQIRATKISRVEGDGISFRSRENEITEPLLTLARPPSAGNGRGRARWYYPAGPVQSCAAVEPASTSLGSTGDPWVEESSLPTTTFPDDDPSPSDDDFPDDDDLPRRRLLSLRLLPLRRLPLPDGAGALSPDDANKRPGLGSLDTTIARRSTSGCFPADDRPGRFRGPANPSGRRLRTNKTS
ncbi:leucine rich repeat family protein [Marssonina coronariae]|uniref:Leucine rich repeat family protein n=1 Tax=Diplocarpon coronariae TaxID=2795749 RepID=A0A218YYC6_9HELO|nr:leucine rich repeat family protein [Marssonina coronariae]